VAAAQAYGLSLSEKELSIIARQGSGSSSRSIPSGFVEWIGGETTETSFARSIFPPDWWEIVDIVAVVNTDEKKVSSTMGHMCVFTSSFFNTRLQLIDKKLQNLKKYIEAKDFMAFGELCETEALELQAITLTSNPPIIYFAPETVALIHIIHNLRKEGLPVYFTLDAGPNVHILAEKKNKHEVLQQLEKVSFIKQIIVNNPTEGARISHDHLF
jgi:diphosphomevalonate decarboxylase